MSLLITADTCVDAWRQIGERLLEQRTPITNIISTVRTPLNIDPSVYRRLNPRHIRPSCRSLRDVESTMFPKKIWERSQTRQQLYDEYKALYRRGKRFARNRGTWGTYFLRLIAFGEDEKNQLEAIIHALTRWKTRSAASLVMHLTSPETDTLRYIGGPCWQFAEVLWHEDSSIDLVLTFRKHDFFQRALGNYLGAARLLEFFAAESGMQPGQIICHSVHAFHDASRGEMRALLDK